MKRGDFTTMRLRISRLVSTLLILLSICQLSVGCRHEDESGSEKPLRDINVVMKEHTEELMAIPGVVGVAIGELEDKTPYIMVMITSDSKELKAKLPQELEGHPVRPFVSGVIKPMDGE